MNFEIKDFLNETFIFAGYIRKCECKKNKGIYIIVNNNSNLPEFVYPSPAGLFKGKDLTVSKEKLKGKWVNDAEILYIGETERSLQDRIKEHTDFWGGNNSCSAGGGCYIAQIENHQSLQVWYHECENPVAKKKELLRRFKKQYGKLPFANLK